MGRTEEAHREVEKASSFLHDYDMRDFLHAFRDPEAGGKLLETLGSLGIE